jgi:hypothetical protein
MQTAAIKRDSAGHEILTFRLNQYAIDLAKPLLPSKAP